MKKLIKILGISVVALTLFLNTNLKNANATSIVAFKIANAYNDNENKVIGCRYTGNVDDRCMVIFTERPGCVNNSKSNDCSF